MTAPAKEITLGDVIELLRAVHRRDAEATRACVDASPDAPVLAMSAVSYALAMLDRQLDHTIGVDLDSWLEVIASGMGHYTGPPRR